MRLFLVLLLLFPCAFSASPTSSPEKFHCLNGTSEEWTEIRCKESQGCQTEIVLPNDENEEYKLILGCNDRLKCGNVKTQTGFVVCCTTSFCNKGFKYLEENLTAEEAAEALAVQEEKKGLPKQLPKPIVNPVDDETEITTSDPRESGSSVRFIGFFFLWLFVIPV